VVPSARSGLLSPAALIYVLDTSVLSSLHQARALDTVLACWPGRWLIPEEVREETQRWVAERERISRVLVDICRRGIASYVEIDPRTEGPTLARLSRALGQGEAAAIAIAYGRGLGAAVDDRAARRACDRLVPAVPWIATEEVLMWCITEGHMPAAEARRIWAATGISDPRRQLL
jgi:predicted nucleic acid-binding protein